MGLDPLKPGHIHFVKYGNNPGTIIIGIDGFRSKAAKTGKHAGTKRGVIRDDNGKCIGAWCEVYRSDWSHPAREEVSLSEYNSGKSNWAKMPETMIKKVAEVAALRMAFPDELGGVYSDDEMDQAKLPDQKDVTQPQPAELEKAVVDAIVGGRSSFRENPGEHVINFGAKYNGKTIAEVVEAVGMPAFEKWLGILEDNAKAKGYSQPPADHQLVIELYELYKHDLRQAVEA
jgi:hypothetical protein